MPARPRLFPIGLDIAPGGIRMLQLASRAGQLHCQARAQCKIQGHWSADGELTDVATRAIRHMVGDGNFVGRDVACAIPYQSLVVKSLRVSVSAHDDMHAKIWDQAANTFGFDLNDAAVGQLQAGTVRQGSELREEVIVMAAERAKIGRFLKSLEPSSVNIVTLDAAPCALYRSLERFIDLDDKRAHALVDVGDSQTLVVIGRGRQLQVYRAIRFGADRMNEAVSRKLSITVDDAMKLRARVSAGGADERVRQAVRDALRSPLGELTSQLAMCLRYHAVTFRGPRPEVVRVTGAQSDDAMLLASLSEALNSKVAPGHPLAALHGGDDSVGWATALGLALKGCKDYFSLPRERACA